MKYRKRNTPDEINKEFLNVAKFLGEEEYMSSLVAIEKGLNNKGYVSDLDDLRFGFELQLYNIERNRRAGRSVTRLATEKLHEGLDFLLGVGQTLPHLSVAAKTELKGKIYGGLKTSGLRPLQHEFRVAAQLSNMGLDVDFRDLEESGGPDFIVKKKGQAFEVEAKCITSFLGHPVQPEDVDKLFLEIRRGFSGWHDREEYPTFIINTKERLPKNRESHLEIVDALNDLSSALGENNYAESDWFIIENDGFLTKREYVREKRLAINYDVLTRGFVYMPIEHPRIIVRIRSARKDKFFKRVTQIVSNASKDQLTGENPAVIWIHVDFLSQSSFEFYTMPDSPKPMFDIIASAVFNSESRRHVSQVIFSGAEYLKKDGDVQRSSFQRVVYNSPHWKGDFLFDGGRNRTVRRHTRIEWLKMLGEQIS